jgi:hypothetical protein
MCMNWIARQHLSSIGTLGNCSLARCAYDLRVPDFQRNCVAELAKREVSSQFAWRRRGDSDR